jgi:hypothetical protein
MCHVEGAFAETRDCVWLCRTVLFTDSYATSNEDYKIIETFITVLVLQLTRWSQTLRLRHDGAVRPPPTQLSLHHLTLSSYPLSYEI